MPDDQLLAAFDVLTVSAALLDENGRVLQVNDSWRRFGEAQGVAPGHTAGSGEDYLGVCAAAAEDGDSIATNVLNGLRSVLSGARRRFELIYPCHAPGGFERWFQLIAAPVPGARGALAIHIDVTDRELARRRLHELQSKLITSARVELAGAMAAALAHELHQPLAAISLASGAASRLAADLSANAPAGEALRDALLIIRDQSLRAGQIARGLRDIGERDKDGLLRSEDLVSLLREASYLALIGPRDRGVRTVVRIPETLPPVRINRVQILQVILHLMLNAAQAVEALPENDASTRAVRLEARMLDPETVEIAVTDNGPGLPVEVSSRLFQPLIPTRTDGMGFGLAICHGIITAHGGRLWAEQNPGGGTILRFVLPVDRPKADET